MSRPTLREYESAIAASPTRHAIFNRPFSVLRRRTEVLLDQITGATLAEEVKKDQRQIRERDRANRCRGCRVIYADELALARHYDLFPKHNVTPERRQKASPKASPRPHPIVDEGTASKPRRKRTQSTPKILEERAAAQSSSGHEIPSSRPPAHVSYVSQSGLGGEGVIQDYPFDVAAYQFSPYGRQHQRSQTMNAVPNSYSAIQQMHGPTYSYNDGHLQPSSPLQLAPHESLVAHPYLPPTQFQADDYATRDAVPRTDALSVPEQAPTLPLPPVLAETNFADSFKVITQDGAGNAKVAPRRPLPKVPNESATLDPIGDWNRLAGKRAVEMHGHMRRGRPERAMRRERSEGNIDGLVLPATFGDVIRAVVATGATGDEGSAVTPYSYEQVDKRGVPVQGRWPTSRYGENEENVAQFTAKPKTDWSKLYEGLPGSVQAEKQKLAVANASPTLREVRPVLTGLTSFSQEVDDRSLSSSPVISRPQRPRTSTNPFMNRDFMRSLPNALRTPPLSPSSTGDRARAAPFQSISGNPFVVLPGEEDAVELWYDAGEPQTPRDGLNDASTSLAPAHASSSAAKGRRSFTLPFSSRTLTTAATSSDMVGKQPESPFEAPFATSRLPYV